MPAVLPMLVVMVVVQAYGSPTTEAGKPPAATATTVVARRAVRAVVIDGKDDDEVWREASAITAFREFSPREDGDPRFPTEAKVAYDDHNFYAFIRAFDPHPDSILKILARRDVRAPTDQLKIVIDSYHDRRTGYEFAVNPAGVKRDYAIYNDNREDDAWDGVWEVATTVDSLGCGVPDTAVAAALRACGHEHVRLRRVARHPAVLGAGRLAGVPAIEGGLCLPAGGRHRFGGTPRTAPTGGRAVRGDEERVGRSRQQL